MTVTAAYDCKQGEKLVDSMTGEELSFLKYVPHEDNHVMCSDRKGITVWIMPDRLEKEGGHR